MTSPPFPSPATAALDPAFVADPTVEVDRASVWFGPKVALSELSCSFGPGVSGRLSRTFNVVALLRSTVVPVVVHELSASVVEISTM